MMTLETIQQPAAEQAEANPYATAKFDELQKLAEEALEAQDSDKLRGVAAEAARRLRVAQLNMSRYERLFDLSAQGVINNLPQPESMET